MTLAARLKHPDVAGLPGDVVAAAVERMVRPPMISLDQSSSVPPYEQVRSQLAAQIASGELVAGTRLPTVRRLAGDLCLAVNTVARSYRELEAAGLVETRGRAGTVVSSSGDQGRERVLAAARDYAALAREVGVDAEDAVRILRAALTPAGGHVCRCHEPSSPV